MKEKDFTPVIMWFCLSAGVIVLAFVRSSRVAGTWNEHFIPFDFMFVALYISWMLIEFRVSRRDLDTESKKTSDSATCQIYGLAQALTFLSALWYRPVWQGPNLAHLLGASLFIFGIGYRIWAIRTLGQFYSHRVRVLSQHRIITSGPYRFTRHPAYAGMILANFGISLYFLNWVTLCIFILMLVPAIVLRVPVEERTLLQIDGYPEFAKERKRLIPKLW